MSYTELYYFEESGDIRGFAQIKNSWCGAMAVWTEMEKRYLPPYEPEWAKHYPKGSFSNGFTRTISDDIKEIWELHSNPNVSKSDLISLLSTMDWVVVMREDVPKVVEAFNSFGGTTSLPEQAMELENLYNSDTKFIAVAWNQTSVNGDAWTQYDSETEESRPHNILKDSGQWYLFEELS